MFEERAGYCEPAQFLITNHKMFTSYYLLTEACKSLYFLITSCDVFKEDFRTWAGSLNMLWAFKSIGESMNATESKKKIVEALDKVSKKLGNTRTVCKKYYVHPGLLKLYEDNSLKQYTDKLDEIENPEIAGELTGSEEILMKILKSLQTN